MKLLTLIFLLTPMSSQALWTFNVINDGSPVLYSDLLFPISYTHSTCQFQAAVINNGSADDVIIINTAGCTSNNHFIVIDGYRYPLSDTVEVNFYSDLHLFTETSNLNNCTSASGIIPTDPPRILLNGLSIEFKADSDALVFTDGNNLYFKYDSINGDIVCDNGVEFIDPREIIFLGGFE
ncbi:hypothetical protein [Marinicella litoralis]|uniref:Uncharacterized protein n=1 Tax=Marinicella litoralis TaxID=644220 RepID=A0A4R6XQ14_9GAMM|nr:hypothetical protein [Marinicella litoralis]TDR20499.1 hypothetical protein C8D91_1473 [Marinicella litoralis]